MASALDLRRGGREFERSHVPSVLFDCLSLLRCTGKERANLTYVILNTNFILGPIPMVSRRMHEGDASQSFYAMNEITFLRKMPQTLSFKVTFEDGKDWGRSVLFHI